MSFKEGVNLIRLIHLCPSVGRGRMSMVGQSGGHSESDDIFVS